MEVSKYDTEFLLDFGQGSFKNVINKWVIQKQHNVAV